MVEQRRVNSMQMSSKVTQIECKCHVNALMVGQDANMPPLEYNSMSSINFTRIAKKSSLRSLLQFVIPIKKRLISFPN